MRLTELDARFVRYETRVETYQVIDGDPATWRERDRPTRNVTGPRHHIINVETFERAQGVMFLCPRCFQRNGGVVGTHWCDVTFAGRDVTDAQGCHDDKGQPVRWTVTGTGLDDLTLKPSILLIGGCDWHGWVTDGKVA